MTTKNNTRDAASAAEIKATGKRWCSSCQSPRAVEGGTLSGRMWRCKACEDRRRQNLNGRVLAK